MSEPDPPNSCTIIWSPSGMNLDELAAFTSLLFELHSELAAPYVAEELLQLEPSLVRPGAPSIARISMASPLVTQLIAGSGGGILSLGMVGFILKNPERLGEFLPRVRESWYRGNARALEEKINYIEAKGHLRARGRAVNRFEREYERHRDKDRE